MLGSTLRLSLHRLKSSREGQAMIWQQTTIVRQTVKSSMCVQLSSLDFLKDAYQLGEDDRVHFKVPFDLQGYGSDDIKVSTSDNGVTVHAKKFVQTDRALSSREYSRTFYIPKS
ncbi:hypothetical protein X801_06963, partial [Opisthorchis viverrini]